MINPISGNTLCSGVTETCEVYECTECAVRDCPHKAEEHYWHDGCPACFHCKGCNVCDGKEYKTLFGLE